MNRFALPYDELARAQQAGLLQRNFHGYSTHGDCDLLAFGVSAINSLNRVYAQNHKRVDDYQKSSLLKDELPLARGLVLRQDDLIRREVIGQLICQFELPIHAIEHKFGIHFAEYFAPELKHLAPLEEVRLVRVHSDRLVVQDIGHLLIRSICMVFDAYLEVKMDDSQPRYSRII